MALVLLVLGAALAIGGTACFSWKAAIVVTGAIVLLAGVDLSRPTRGPES